MINRIVRLSFASHNVDSFLEIFEASRMQIAAFSGCQGLQLLRDAHKPNVFFTYSLWESESDLEAYRHSALFESTWAKTKALFDDKPQAWSTILVETVK